MPKKLTQEEFIAKAVAVHGVGRYDYSRAVYVAGQNHPIVIICLHHGAFEKSPHQHIAQKRGCPKCGRTKASTGRRVSTEDFLIRAQSAHGEKYDYSQTVCSHSKSKVAIICPTHGVFEQEAGPHMGGRGCPKCQLDSRSFNTADFIAKSQAAHGEKYDYSLVSYQCSRAKVKITCPEHGVFEQTAGQHMRGRGCPKCRCVGLRGGWLTRSNGRISTLYFLRILGCEEEFFKIGVTVRSVEERYKRGLPDNYSYEIIAQHISADAARIFGWEQSILTTFAHLRYKPKTSFQGESECFSSADEILAIFPL